MKAYQVVHYFDVDNGCGDAVRHAKVVGVFPDRPSANAFAQRYRDPHVYGVPYDNLMCGILHVQEGNVADVYANAEARPDGFWWLHTPRYDAETQQRI